MVGGIAVPEADERSSGGYRVGNTAKRRPSRKQPLALAALYSVLFFWGENEAHQRDVRLGAEQRGAYGIKMIP